MKLREALYIMNTFDSKGICVSHDYINILRKIECIKLLKLGIIYFFLLYTFMYPTKFPL